MHPTMMNPMMTTTTGHDPAAHCNHNMEKVGPGMDGKSQQFPGLPRPNFAQQQLQQQQQHQPIVQHQHQPYAAAGDSSSRPGQMTCPPPSSFHLSQTNSQNNNNCAGNGGGLNPFGGGGGHSGATTTNNGKLPHPNFVSTGTNFAATASAAAMTMVNGGGHQNHVQPNSMAMMMMNSPKVVCQPPPLPLPPPLSSIPSQNSIIPMAHMVSSSQPSQQQQHQQQQQITMCPLQQQQQQHGGMGDVYPNPPNSNNNNNINSGSYRPSPNRQFYNTGAEMGSLSNPLATIPDVLKPRFGPSRDEMKDRLADSLAADPSISCLPGFKMRDDTRVNCVASFPYGMQNPNPNPNSVVVHSQRKMFGGGGAGGGGVGVGQHPPYDTNNINNNRPITPLIRRTQAAMGKQEFGEAKFQSLQRMGCPFPNPGCMPSVYPQMSSGAFYQSQNPPPGLGPAAVAAGISCLGTANQAAQGHYRRGRNGPWSSMGTPGPSGSNVYEAKALKEGYRKELQKQIEQTKIRREEETRREKDVHHHPLGANYAQPKTYIPPKCLMSNLSPLEMGMRLGRSDSELDTRRHNNNSQQPDDTNFGSSIQHTQPPHQSTNGPDQRVSASSSAQRIKQPQQQSTNYESRQNPWNYPLSSSPTPSWPPMMSMPYALPFPPPFFHPPQPSFPASFNMPPPRPPALAPKNSNSWQDNPIQMSWSEKNGTTTTKLQQLRPNLAHSSSPSDAQDATTTQEANIGKCGNGKPLSNIQVPNLTPNQPQLPENLDKLIDELPLKQYTWQTSDQLPDPALKTAIYKEELRRQIIQKKKDEEDKAMKEREEEEKLERRIHEYDERMRREVQDEQNRMFHREGLRANRKEAVMRMTGEFTRTIDRDKREATIRDKTKYQQQHDPGSAGDDDDSRHNNDIHHHHNHIMTTEEEFEREVERKINSKPENNNNNNHHHHQNKQNVHHIRKSSPPIPTVQKRLETQSDSALLSGDRLSGAAKNNLNALSEMLNSLGLETRRVEKAIQRKMMMKR